MFGLIFHVELMLELIYNFMELLLDTLVLLIKWNSCYEFIFLD